jgi:hypothetical protein
MHRSRLNLLLLAFLVLASCTHTRPAEQLTVITHPDGLLYVGDQVSFEVLAPAARENNGKNIEVKFNGQTLGTAGFGSFGIGRRSQATLWWIWNTRDLEPGRHTLTFTRLPDGTTWDETIVLHPAKKVPTPEPDAHWASTTTVCCNIYYITGTAAERDLSFLTRAADEQSTAVAAQLGSILDKRITLVFVPRVIGHGGFTADGVYVSYLDGNYIGNEMSILFHHEFVHYYDAVLNNDYRPNFFQEGLAVYLSGGHFKPESLAPRAAALLDLGWYLPLAPLANNFYNSQHDIGYLEAGALIQYLVETYGWEAFNNFYRTIPAPDGQTDSAVIDAALRKHFGISFTDLETAYVNYLRAQNVTDNERNDLRLTVEFFDDVRRYQQAFDPSAYFLTAWLPDGSLMRQREIVADFLRYPDGWQNRIIELFLHQAQQELFSGDYKTAQRTLQWANWTMDVVIP